MLSQGTALPSFPQDNVKKLPVSKMCEKNGKLTLRMPAEHCKALERLCDELGLEYTATKRHGSFVLAKRFSEEEDLS